jgi:small ligand-binding sensory domain FIST
MSSGISAEPDPLTAAAQACERAMASAAARAPSLGTPDLAIAFVSSHHAWSMRAIGSHVQRLTGASRLIGVTAEAVLGGGQELEGLPGISVLVAWMPGVTLTPFLIDDLIVKSEDDAEREERRLASLMGVDDNLRAILLFLDPQSAPLSRLLPAMNRARGPEREDAPTPPIIGGMASGSRTPDGGGNVMLLDDRIMDRGGIGLSLSGEIRVDAIVSQGCRPVGPNLVVTKCRGNLVLELGGKPAMAVLQELIEEATEEERNVLRRGLLIGRVVDEYKERFGVGDYLIRGIMGVDQTRGGLAVGEVVRVGQTLRLHVRDAATASADLAMLLDGQKLHTRPAGALLFTCNSRGRRLFPEPSHDVGAIQRAFRQSPGGAEMAKGGTVIASDSSMLPLAGFFAAGEIGPVGRDAYLHGHSASIAIFRER